MGRRKRQGEGVIISVSMYIKHKKMLEELIDGGYYNKVSEIVRYGIEYAYKEKIGREIDIIIDEAPKIKMEELITEYKLRRNKMTVKGRSKYEHYSKKWLEGNFKLVEEAFPNKSIDDVYIELESIIRVS